MTNSTQRTQRHWYQWLTALALFVGWMPVSADATTVDALCDLAADPCVVDQTILVDDGSVFDLGGRALRVTSNGKLDVRDGTMTIVAGAITVEDGGELSGRRPRNDSGPGGAVVLRASSLEIAGTVDASGVPPGRIDMSATGDVDLSGVVAASALARDQSGGTIDVEGANIVLSGEIDADAGTEDSLGGDVELTATGDVEVSGSITVVGPDGGTVTITAGAGASDGNITLAETSNLEADGKFQGGFGGSIDLDATGNGVETGRVQMGGSMSVTGATAGEELGGGSGGCLSVNATGNVVADNAAASLTVEGGGPDGDGGELDIVSDLGSVVLLTPVDVSTPGAEGGGGALAVDALGNIIVFGEILAFGGDGGEVALISSGAGVTIDDAVTIDVGGRDLGGGGAICLESASMPGDAPSTVVVNGDLLADGGGVAGSGGAIEIIGFDSARLSGLATADGGLGGGTGGAVAITALGGPAFVEGTVRARGRGESGGSVTVDGDRIEVPGTIEVTGVGADSGNTDIGLRARGAVNIAGTLNASSAPGSGGLVEIIADGDVVVGGTLTADGGADPGGQVSVLGCTVLVCGFNAEPQLCGGATGLLRTDGPSGTNRVTGRNEALIFGSMETENSGRNEILVRPPRDDNSTILGTVSPAAIVVEDGALTACPVCGNRVVEPPETCDDGNTDDGDGCSATCRLEGDILRGDVNGDSLVDQADLGFLATEIFDGDGDAVANVSGGAFAGGPGADVNSDEGVSAADFVALSGILGGQ